MRRPLKVEALLTLVIALGGIATGIGAIWAALVARRQAQFTERSLAEQREFLMEQNEIARSQAQLTEQSLAQTERSLAEQGKSLREQNERARLNIEVDLLFRMADHFETPHFLSRRRSAAKYAIDNYLVDDDMVETPRLNRATRDVANFFEQLGHLQRLGALQAESIYNRFSIMTRAYWLVFEPAIQKMREELKDPCIYEDFERINRVVSDLDSELGIDPPTQAAVRRIVEEEVDIGEESPTTTPE
jgi:hypothetical protein